MAALTWRNVAAPNMGNPQDSLNSAAKLLAASTGGLSGALTQFGDQQALQQLAQYSDAQKLQADIQSGRFNTANVSPDALTAMMNRPTALLTNVANQQTFDYNAQKNPLELSRQGIANATSQEALDQSRLANPFTIAAVKRANELAVKDQPNKLVEIDQKTALNAVNFGAEVKKAQHSADLANLTQPQSLLNTARANAETNRTYPIEQNTRQALEQVATLQNQGQLPSAVEGNAYFQQLVDSGAHPVVLNAVKGMLEQSFGKGAVGAVSTSVGGSVGPTQLLNNAVGTAGTGTSVGERNNNQGNLMGSGWVTSMPGYLGNDAKGYARFTTNDQGTAANNRQLERYWEGTQATGGKPVRTIDSIINTWAPPETASNKTGNSAESIANYKAYVQKRTGIDMTKELTKEQLGPVRTAMQEFETGNVSGASANTALIQAAKLQDAAVPASTSPVAGSPASTVLAQAANPANMLTSPADESTDIFKLRRKYQTLTQQAASLGAQDNTNFSSDVLAGASKNMDMTAAFNALKQEPAFADVHKATLIAALTRAQQKSGLATFGALLPAVRQSLSGDTEWNSTKGAPWFTPTINYDKLDVFAKQAGDLPVAIQSVDNLAKRKDELALVSFYMPQIEALNAEKINLYQQQLLGRQGATAALDQVNKRIKGYTDIINPLITSLDKEFNGRLENSPETGAKLKAQAAAEKLKEDAVKANEIALLNQAKTAEQRKEAARIGFEKAPPSVMEAVIKKQLMKDAEDKNKAAILLAQKQEKQAKLQGLEWLTPETAAYVDPKLAASILNDPERELLIAPYTRRILQNRSKN